jgi:hypothetical protein
VAFSLRQGLTLILVGMMAAVAVVFVTVERDNSGTSYPSQLETAAQALESATASGGPGYRFDVVQRQVEYPKAGGSDLPIVDAASPQIIQKRVDHLYVNSVLARGRVGPGVVWMEMRFGPDETTTPDYVVAPTMFGVIAKDGGLWRNDGLGWYATTVSPGVGMDPTTASLLPTLLRTIATVTDEGADVIAGQAAHRYRGQVDVSVFPGVVASDGAAFTESPIGVDVWLDGSNRLIALEGRARNLNESTLDLKIVTRILITYQAAGSAPDPLPSAPPPSASGVTVGVP